MIAMNIGLLPARTDAFDLNAPVLNGNRVEKRLKLRLIFRRYAKEKGGSAPPFSLSVSFSGKRPECQ